jgi:tol-pal system beta propeller repeat protein TolB
VVLAGIIAAGVLVVAAFLWRAGSRSALTYDGAPSWSPDSERIAFSVEANGQTDVYIMAADGGARQALTSAPGEDGAPAFSPDGRHIAFESNRDGNFEIYVMDADGRNPRRLSNHPAADRAPAWMPDGRLVFLSDRDRRPDFDVYAMNLDGSRVERLTTTGRNFAPQVSPDGRAIAVQMDQEVRVISLDDRSVRRLTFSPENGMSPTWSPDGRRLAFATTRNQRLEIFTMTADGTEQRTLVSMPGASVLDPRWSPDGSRVAFVQVPAPDDEAADTSQPYAIFVVEVETGRIRRLSP